MTDPLAGTPYRSFTAEDTNFTLVRSHTPIDVDGYKIGELTGLVKCDCCGQTGKDVDEIPHAKECDQSDVHSWYWLVARGFIDAEDVPHRYRSEELHLGTSSSAPHLK